MKKDSAAYQSEVRLQMHRYQTFREAGTNKVTGMTAHFDLEAFVNVTEQDKFNLLMIKALKSFQWWTKTTELNAGETLGN